MKQISFYDVSKLVTRCENIAVNAPVKLIGKETGY